MLDGFGEELADHADRVKPQREHAGQDAETDRGQEEDAEDQLRHGAHAVQEQARRCVDQRVGGGVPRGQEAEDEGKSTQRAVPAMLMASVSSSGRPHPGSRLKSGGSPSRTMI